MLVAFGYCGHPQASLDGAGYTLFLLHPSRCSMISSVSRSMQAEQEQHLYTGFFAAVKAVPNSGWVWIWGAPR